MDERLKVSYETIGSSSYMTVTCPLDMELIHYQVEMMLANDIKKFLSVSRQVIDGETVIYYNITSRIPLKQVLEKRKLTRKELLRLLEGAILAIRDSADFRLPSEGIVMEAEKIYVNPASCDPAFMFLPVQGAGVYGIKELVTELIMKDRIEMSDDNLIQVLLKELNSQPFSVDRLEKSLEPYGNASAGIRTQRMAQSQSISSQPIDFQPINRQPMSLQPSGVQSAAMQSAVSQSAVAQSAAMQSAVAQAAAPQPAAFQAAVTPPLSQAAPPRASYYQPAENLKRPEVPTKKDHKKTARKKKEKADAVKAIDGEDEFDSEKAKKKFMIPQAFLMIAVAASISFGLFMDENGAVAVNTVLAFVIGIAVVEIILYREAYVNSRNSKKGKKASKKKEKKADKTKDKSSKARPAPPRPPLPRQTSGQQPVQPRQVSEPQPMQSRQVSEPRPVQSRQISEPQPMQFRQVSEPQHSMSWQESRLQGADLQQTSCQQRPDFQQMPFSQPQPGVQPMPSVNFSAYETEDTCLGDETELWGGTSQGGMPAYLEYYENGKLSRIPINPVGGVVIGRLKEQVDFAVKSPRVGKVHARFFAENGQFFVVDINSKNGTYINGSRTRIESNMPCPLHDKDRIMLADSEFTIRCAEG